MLPILNLLPSISSSILQSFLSSYLSHPSCLSHPHLIFMHISPLLALSSYLSHNDLDTQGADRSPLGALGAGVEGSNSSKASVALDVVSVFQLKAGIEAAYRFPIVACIALLCWHFYKKELFLILSEPVAEHTQCDGVNFNSLKYQHAFIHSVFSLFYRASFITFNLRSSLPCSLSPLSHSPTSPYVTHSYPPSR